MTSFAMLLLPILVLTLTAADNLSYRELRELASLLNVGLGETEEGDYITVCSQEPMELALVIDASASIRRPDFIKGQKFLTDFLSIYDIGSGKKQVRVSAVKYGKGVYKDDSFNLNTYKNKEDVLNHVTNMKHEYGTYTDTGPGIDYMRTVQMVNTRPAVPKVAIVLTDGNSQEPRRTQESAALARAENITMFAVGVGSKVSNAELVNIAGDQARVIQVNSYDDLKDIKERLARKTCITKPKPTTTPIPTTPIPMRAPECYEMFPSDINFVFNPASLGVDSTGWVTQFISHTITNQELQQGFQYGVISGDCPDDGGFALNQFRSVGDIRSRLDRYDRNNLPALVSQTARVGFSSGRGGRAEANKVAVIFLGKAKVDPAALNRAIQQLLDQGTQVFVASTDPGVSPSLPRGVRFLESGSSISQAQELVSHICHLDKQDL